MWKILLVATILVLTAAAALPDKAAKEENSTDSHISDPTISSTISTIVLPESSQHPSSEEPAVEEEPTTRRAHITYDQRQDGQYNIRADLENFMIVVIPPNPVAGVNLLDLLTRSSTKRSNLKKINKKHQLSGKHFGLSRPEDFRLNFFNQAQQQQQQQKLQSLDLPSARVSEYIEGRTPYRVDISSAENDFGRIHPDPQVDVLPPPYPVHLHLMRPHHLEAEPTVVQPSSQGKLFQFLNRLGLGEGRIAKAIRDHPVDNKELHSNKIVNSDGRSYNAKYNAGGGDGDMNSSVELNNNDGHYSISLSDSITSDDINGYKTRSINAGDFDGELKLIGASEQCGPDRRRNSYGICQFVPNVD